MTPSENIYQQLLEAKQYNLILMLLGHGVFFDPLLYKSHVGFKRREEVTNVIFQQNHFMRWISLTPTIQYNSSSFHSPVHQIHLYLSYHVSVTGVQGWAKKCCRLWHHLAKMCRLYGSDSVTVWLVLVSFAVVLISLWSCVCVLFVLPPLYSVAQPWLPSAWHFVSWLD